MERCSSLRGFIELGSVSPAHSRSGNEIVEKRQFARPFRITDSPKRALLTDRVQPQHIRCMANPCSTNSVFARKIP